MGRKRAIAIAMAVALCAAGPAAAQSGSAPDTLSPEGPATLERTWLGARPAIAYGPRVIVEWSVRVGPGGRAGRVALRTISGIGGPPKTGGSRGATVTLPAEPGTYSFPARLALLDSDEIALDQETGGHAILATHPHRGDKTGVEDDLENPWAVDLWRPPLAPGERREPDERMRGRELLVETRSERDIDADGYGDESQDVTDLALYTTTARRGRRRTHVRVEVRNAGRRAIALPQLDLDLRRGDRLRGLRAPSCSCTWLSAPLDPADRAIALPSLAPGAAATVSFTVIRAKRTRRLRARASAEGVDPTPERAVIRLRR